VAVAVVTSSATIRRRLPLLWEAWLRDCGFTVLVITDGASAPLIPTLASKGIPRDLLVLTDCPAGKEGLVCKTRAALEGAWARLPTPRWALRVMDDTLVMPEQLMEILSEGEAHNDQPLCVC
jgi:hypothetical protein